MFRDAKWRRALENGVLIFHVWYSNILLTYIHKKMTKKVNMFGPHLEILIFHVCVSRKKGDGGMIAGPGD